MADPLDEAVELQPHDPAWARRFDRERVRLADALGTEASAIEHIGSTAVPGLDAKPVVDVLVGVPAVPPTEHVRRQLTALGYEYLGEAGVAGRHHFRRRRPDAVNVHVVQYGGRLWSDNLLLRDHLRRRPDARAAYSEAKRCAIERGGHRLLAYSELKSATVADLLARARAEASQRT